MVEGKRPENIGKYSVVCGRCFCATTWEISKENAEFDWNRRAEPESNPLTAEQIKQLKPGDTVTTIHSAKIKRMDEHSFETKSSMWGYGDVADGTVKVYLRKPER